MLDRRELQRQAYQKAKARRAKDPRYLELKAAAKARRREQSERVKQQRKAAQAAEKAARSAERAQAEGEQRAFYQQGRVATSSTDRLRELLQRQPSLIEAEVVIANDVS